MTSSLPVVAPEADLFFNDLLVAHLKNVIQSDGTYYATFELCVSDTKPGLAARIVTFIRFFVDWNTRCSAREPVHRSEFGQYGDLIGTDKWRVKWRDDSLVVAGMPNFSEGNEVAWNT